MDKENGKASDGGTSSAAAAATSGGKLPTANPPDPSSLLDAASLFAYWPRGDANANAANLFAAAAGSAYGLGPHPGLPFGMLPTAGAAAGRGHPYTSVPSSSSAYSNAYTNTLSVAASQAASLGIPAASAAWWSMASHLAAQDYLARLQASGMNFPGLGNPADPYASLGLPSLGAALHNNKSKNSSSKSSSSLPKSKQDKASPSNSSSSSTASLLNSSSGNKNNDHSSSSKSKHHQQQQQHQHQQQQASPSLPKYPTASPELSIQPSSMKLPSSNDAKKAKNDYLKSMADGGGAKKSNSIFANPLSLAEGRETGGGGGGGSDNNGSAVPTSQANNLPPIPASILSDPNAILGGVRLPPDTEIIKYTSSIVGPKIPGTTNRGRKKTISLDPPSVSVHPSHSSTGMLLERSSKKQKLDTPECTTPPAGDRVEVIKLPPTNGSPSGISVPSFSGSGGFNESSIGGDGPLNLSLKPTSNANHHTTASSSLNSLSNMSASLGMDRVSRRKPGPKPRKVVQSPSSLPPGAPSASLVQLFSSAADSPRPPSRTMCNDGSEGCIPPTTTTTTTTNNAPNHSNKDGRPRNLGRGVSKPKKNTVASLLAQSRALGIKPMPILDPNASMSQQMSLLKSNILAAQQFIAESGGDEKTLNKFLQEKLRGTLSDTSTVDASTDSDNLTDSNHTDSEMEVEAAAAKKQKQFDERALRVPLEKGWKRETIIRGITKSGGIKGDVTYIAPDCTNKFKQMSDITQYLDYQKSVDLCRENFTFSCRIVLGDYLQVVPPEYAVEGEFIRLSEDDVNRRLEDLRASMRTSLPVEQRIEVARRQQAARAAARLDREQARLAREMERSERQEAARRDREARSQQLLEGRKRLAFTLEQKIQIISEIEGGKTKSDVSRELGLASSTVATIWKNRDSILSAYGSEALLREEVSPASSVSASAASMLEPDRPPKAPQQQDSLLSLENMAKRKRQEEMERHRQEEQQRKQQERELKRQQNALLKEQERERRRQHMSLVKALESRRKLEERERKKQQLLAEKQANKEKKMEQRKMEMEILAELRKPCEDLELSQTCLPEFERIKGLKLPGKAFADVLMAFEFLHNFGETLGFDMESLPTLDNLQQALLYNDGTTEAEEELLSVMTHLVVCAIEDPGIPNPARHTTILGQSLRQADITHANLSEILRIYLYANATGEVKALTGVHFERDREKRVADHHQNECEMQQTQAGKNAQYYELLHENETWKMSIMLKDKPFLALSPTDKAAILAYLCNELLQNKAVIRQIEGSLETAQHNRKEKFVLDGKIRKLRMLHNRKVRTEAVEKAQAKADGESPEVTAVDSPALQHKDDLLDDEENEMSENESVGTQPEEEEDNKLSGEELGKKLEKLLKTSESQLQMLNACNHQLRATCYGQDRYWRRYWSLPKAGGIFVEAMESADPDVLLEQEQFDVKTSSTSSIGINSVDDVKRIVETVVENQSINDPATDKEVSSLIGGEGDKEQENQQENNKQAEKVERDENQKNNSEETSNEFAGQLEELRRQSFEMFSLTKSSPESPKENDNENKLTEVNANEHRKTPNRLSSSTTTTMTTTTTTAAEVVENGNIDKKNLDALQKSVDQIVQCLERENHDDLNSTNNKESELTINNDGDGGGSKLNHIKQEAVEEEPAIGGASSKKFSNLFEKLGECMERENKSEEELKMDVKQEIKEELKNEILNELKTESFKSEIKQEINVDEEMKNDLCGGGNGEKWFSILNKDGLTCETVHLTAGNKWDNGVGACTRDNITELKIPVFPPPNSGVSYTPNSCDSPAPLQMTAEESAQLEYIKKNGLPKPGERKGVPFDKRYGWWRICDVEQLRTVLDSLHVRGARERELKRTFVNTMQAMYERQGTVTIEDGCKESTELTGVGGSLEDLRCIVDGAPVPDKPGFWHTGVAHRVDMFLLEQIEALEDKVANASMQIKGWRPPIRDVDPPMGQVVDIAKERLMSLEANIERRYLKPPLGINTGDPNLAAIAQEAAGVVAPAVPILGPEDVPKGLAVWREAINRSQTSAQLAMCLYTLEASIAWDKSIMKANCQFCNSGDNEDKLLLCDGCDKGYHTYCFKPKMDNIPDGDWYCHECMNKATGERNCIVCGKKQSTTSTKLVLCEICPRAYHTDCMRPPLNKCPRGKWYCTNCISKKPQKKASRKSLGKKEGGDISDHPPASPAPSHSSATTNEDLNHQTTALNSCSNQSDVSNSSINAGSPSCPKKERANCPSKKLLRELAPCKAILEDLECHDDAWPFLLPVNTKQFPTYKKIIKCPMDLSTIKKRLQDVHYKSRDEFCADVRQIFNNCETFNEDDSPVGKAGHCMRQFFESRWNELCLSSNS